MRAGNPRATEIATRKAQERSRDVPGLVLGGGASRPLAGLSAGDTGKSLFPLLLFGIAGAVLINVLRKET